MTVAEVNGLKLHYWTIGAGPDLVFLHGLGGNLAIWHLSAVPLLRNDYRITTYDLRGHGKSDLTMTGYTTADHASDLLGLFDAVGIEKAHLVGHSLGADVSLHFALDNPDRVGKLILVEAGLQALVSSRKREEWIGWTYWSDLILKNAGIVVPPEKRTDWRFLLRCSLEGDIMFGPNQGKPRRREKFLRLFEETSLAEDYEIVGDLTLENIANIENPKLFIYDEASPYIGTYHELCRYAQNYEAVLLPPSDMPHFFPLEQPEVLVQYIRTFIETDPVASGADVGNNS